MRSYAEYCSVAKALDLVGDRWSLLIVRELLILGGRRFGELQDGLPGIATNLLTERLRHLEEAGVVSRDEAGRYTLTSWGEMLAEPVYALARWGAPLMATMADSESFRSHWLATPIAFIFGGQDPGRPALEAEIRAGDAPVTLKSAWRPGDLPAWPRGRPGPGDQWPARCHHRAAGRPLGRDGRCRTGRQRPGRPGPAHPAARGRLADWPGDLHTGLARAASRTGQNCFRAAGWRLAMRDLEGRTYLVTGGNTGIGRATATGLASRGGRVYLACRSAGKGQAAAMAITTATGNPAVGVLPLDLARLDSVRGCAAAFRQLGQPLHGLINNAGLPGQRGRQTADGFELAFGVDHLGHFALTLALLDCLTASGPARVVTVSSDAHYQAPGIDFAPCGGPAGASPG